MSREEILAGPVLKIERAEHHISDLRTQIGTYLSDRPCRLVHSYDPVTLTKSLATRASKPVPDAFALTIGDAVHNLRTSLDLIVFAMVSAKSKSPRSIRFPFANNPSQLLGTVRSTQVHLAGEAVVREIHKLQPYPAGQLRLWDLHQLDIIDKHKLLIPMASPAHMTGNDIARYIPIRGSPNGVVWALGARFSSVLKPADAEDERYLRSQPAFETDTEWQPPFEICFDHDQLFAHQNVLDVLSVLTSVTKYAVHKLAEAECQ